MRNDVTILHGIVWLTIALGVLVLSKWREITAAQNEKAERFWQEAMQPYSNSRTHEYTKDDTLNDYPLLPSEYEDWKT